MRNPILIMIMSMAYWMVKFELAFAHYRQQRIDDELAYGSVFDIEELIARKSDIATEISTIRANITTYEAAGIIKGEV